MTMIQTYLNLHFSMAFNDGLLIDFMAFNDGYISLLYSTLIPIKIYNNADLLKQEIITENKKLCGIYRWVNTITKDTYIGSSIDLSKRFRIYFDYNSISDFSKGSRINRALLKYGYSNFSLEILELCEKDIVLEREQHYIDSLNPVYNVLKVAGSSFGHKHSEESILKRVNAFVENKKAREALKTTEPIKDNELIINFPLQGSKRPLETIELMRKNHSRSKIVYEYKADKVTLIAKYDSLRQAQEVTGLTREYISRCIKADKLAHNGSWFSFTEL